MARQNIVHVHPYCLTYLIFHRNEFYGQDHKILIKFTFWTFCRKKAEHVAIQG